jgi:hypothetical protein
MNSFKTACVTCPVGRHSKGGTQQTCKLCQEGYSTSKSGSAACDICLPGFGRQSTGGSFTCTACEPGYFSTGLGACNSCSAGFTSGPKAASCPSELCVADGQGCISAGMPSTLVAPLRQQLAAR